MSRIRTSAILLALAVAAVPAARADEAKVTYVSGTTVYVDAGTENGLLEGAILEVVRDGAVVARLQVGYVTAKRASASPLGPVPEPPVRVGDLVRFAPTAAAAPPPATATSAEETPAQEWRRSIRGRVGLRWLAVRDRTGLGQDFSQPALDLRIVGTGVGGEVPLDFDVDLRPRRTYRTRADGTSDDTASNRVYSLMGAWRPGNFRVAIGRQMNPSLGPVVLLDGLSGEYRNPRFAAGFFAGTEPDPEDFAFDSATKDYGLFAEGTSAPGAATRWWVNGGAVTSTTNGEINRDFLYVTGRVAHGGFQAFALQETDVNRGWRKDAEGSSLTRSGSYVALRQRFAQAWTVHGGWDSRRHVRVYRDFVTPVTDFDDAYREGTWGGVEWNARRWLVGVDGRRSTGGDAGAADAYTLRLGTMGWTRARIDGRARVTHYSGPLVEGDLLAAGVGFDLWEGRLRLDVHGGARDETETTLFADSKTVRWYGAEVDLLALRQLFVTLSFDRTTGGDEDNEQLYLTCSYRF